jgi:alginate O-acetyltransferase complex protein AlgI
MLFNSLSFVIFIGIFFAIYFALGKRQKIYFSLLASYVFYGWWDWRFLGLIAASTAVDYFVGLKIESEENQSKRKKMLLISVFFNLGMLAFFKYFNFFIDSFSSAMLSLGWQPSWNTLNIILPVGISFYTFQTMSYTIDIYRKQLSAEKDFWTFATYVAFFPQLVAGPIVRAKTLLPQFKINHKFERDRFILGFGQILLGFFKKLVVADSIAGISDAVFAAPEASSSINVIFGVICYAFQIYCDFSGYSDIAIGLARIMGYDFPKNFNMPYFSKGFSEFWQRWHISLSSWLRDYLYIFSLGGNRQGKFITFRNLMLTMLLGGLWHGAAWTFVFWGALHGTYLILQRLAQPLLKKISVLTGTFLYNLLSWIVVFTAVCFAWIYFRSPDFETANEVISRILDFENMSLGSIKFKFLAIKALFVILLLVVGEYISTKIQIEKMLLSNQIFRNFAFLSISILIILFGTFTSEQFIYFQF